MACLRLPFECSGFGQRCSGFNQGCYLESCDFAARTNCVEHINWLGKCFATLGKGAPRIRTGGSDLSSKIKDLVVT